MTERDFYLLCAGFEQKQLAKAKERRKLMYVIVSGYADPRTLPPIHRWMPLDDDPVYNGPDIKDVMAWDKKFRGGM